jgi:hypothetical protein
VEGIWESGGEGIKNILKELDSAKLQMLVEVLQSMLELASAPVR